MLCLQTQYIFYAILEVKHLCFEMRRAFEHNKNSKLNTRLIFKSTKIQLAVGKIVVDNLVKIYLVCCGTNTYFLLD